MMLLHQQLAFNEIDNRFSDFLDKKTADKIIRMDEMHPSDDNDGHYVLAIWFNLDDYKDAKKSIERTIKKRKEKNCFYDWEIELIDIGPGMLIVNTYI